MEIKTSLSNEHLRKTLSEATLREGGGAEFAVAADIRLAADDVKIGFNQVALAIMPAWGGAERLVELVGYSKALLLAGTGRILAATEAERIGLIDQVIPRASFDQQWRLIARTLASPQAGQVKRVMRGVPTTEAVAAFAKDPATHLTP